jgi:hypothetical protein
VRPQLAAKAGKVDKVDKVADPPEQAAPARKPRPQRPKPQQLLQPRSDTALQLSCSVLTAIRMEQAGILTSVKLLGAPKGKGYNVCSEVEALARREAPDGGGAE